MAAELCLHLARRLDAGTVARRKLIERGMNMSTVANERTTSADGLIKHILAHEAHRGIDDRLLALRKEDNAIQVDVIYNKFEMNSASQRNGLLGSSMRHNGAGSKFDFASKFNVNTSWASQSSESRTTGILRKSSKTSKEHSTFSGEDSIESSRHSNLSSRISKNKKLKKRQSLDDN